MFREFQELATKQPRVEVPTLRLALPDWGKFDTVVRHRYPFALWRIGSQRLLHYWLDYAIDQGFRRVLLYCQDRPADVRAEMKKATLWPLDWEVIALPDGEEVTEALPLESLPTPWARPEANKPHDGWSLVEYAFALEKIWYEHAHHGQQLATESSVVGRYSYVHPTVKLNYPIWIGDNVYIGPNCEIGPNASIGAGCVLEGESSVSDSKIEHDTFIGAHTEIHRRYVCKRTMIDLKNRTRLDNVEPAIADGVTPSPSGKPGSFERLTALALWFLFRFKKLIRSRSRLSNQLWLQRYPRLLDVVGGKCRLYGVLPRTKEELADVRDEWKEIIRSAPRGVFSYADAMGCHSPEDELEPLHAVYQATHSPKYINPICRRFVWSLIRRKR